MTPNTRCEQVVEFTDQTGLRRRVRFVPCEREEWERIEEVWNNPGWRHVSQRSITEFDQWMRPIGENQN